MTSPTPYQQGALTYLEMSKVPEFAGFLRPGIFAMSLGWFQTKKKRGYTEEQAEAFLAGFAAAPATMAAIAKEQAGGGA